MKNTNLFRLSVFLILLLLPAIVSAESMLDVITNVNGGQLVQSFEEGGFLGIITQLKKQVIALLDVVALVLLVRAGLKLINSDDENKLGSAKATIAATVIGIILVHLAGKLTEIFVPVTGSGGAGGGVLEPGVSAAKLALEIGGIIDWITGLVAVLGVLMIIIGGIQTIASFGKEEGTAQLKRTVFGVIGGILMLLLAGGIKATFGLPEDVAAGAPGTPDALAIVTDVIYFVKAALSFLGIIAVAVVVYAGILMIVNLGNEDQFQKARSLIIRAMIGLAIILLASAIANFAMELVSNV